MRVGIKYGSRLGGVILSVILVNYNNGTAIASCLSTIFRYLSPRSGEYEVLVVDNSSTDNSRQLLHEGFPGLNLIENPKNVGFSRAVNQAFRRSRGKYILLLNPDMTVLPESVNKMTGFMDDHPQVGLLLPKLLNPDGTLQLSCRTFYDFPILFFRKTPLGKMFPNHRVIRRHLMMDWNHEKAREVDWGLGACMLLRRAAISGNDLLDERFFLYFEDVDLCFRLKKEGWKVIYYPEAVMVHAHMRHSSRGWISRAKWEHLKSLIKFFGKHRRFKEPVSRNNDSDLSC